MNTDNMAVSGETIDYGPCAFMDEYDPATVFSSIDQRGRYAYGNQPAIAQWNLARLAETLLPLLDPGQDRAIELATAALDGFAARFDRHWLDGMRRKLGLVNGEEADVALVQGLLRPCRPRPPTSRSPSAACATPPWIPRPTPRCVSCSPTPRPATPGSPAGASASRATRSLRPSAPRACAP
jgi:hypothetical protein